LLIGSLVVWACGDGQSPTGVTNRTVTTVSVSPSTVSLAAFDETRQLSVVVWDQNGDGMTGLSTTWLSADPNVAVVSSSGLVTARGNGQATIQATVGGKSGSASVAVGQVAASVEVSPKRAARDVSGCHDSASSATG